MQQLGDTIMTEEPNEIEVIDPKMLKKIEEVAINTFRLEMKKDYRATVVHREEKGGIDDSEAALIHVNETAVDELGHPLELDVKGSITPYQSWLFTEMRYGRALMQLKDWKYFERPVKQKDGSYALEQIPVDLAQIYMMAQERTGMARGGTQSWKHIEERKANAGRNQDDSKLSKAAAGFFGVKREKRDKEETREQYGQNPDQ